MTEEACKHDWYISHDWEGDPGVVGGVHEFTEWTCILCGDVTGEEPDSYTDPKEEAKIDAAEQAAFDARYPVY